MAILRRPKQYEPGEINADVTSQLSKDIPAEAPRPRWSDITVSAGLAHFRAFLGNRTSQLPEDNGPGVAVGDFNNDGLDDVFLVSAGGPLDAPKERLAPCELYQNLGHGQFRKVDLFPELHIRGMAAAWGDYDEDGFLDLVVTGYNTLMLFHNEGGTGRFTLDPHFENRPGYWAGAAWGDYDGDRHLDLYVCGYVQYQENQDDRGKVSKQVGTSVPYTLNPASYLPGTNLLFHSLSGGRFEEVGAALGVRNPEGRSLAAVWHDFDDDGRLDLYVANDISDNVLYHNIGGRFEDISHPAHVADYRSAMGLAVGDFDRDGDDDLYVSHWVAQENALYQNLVADYRPGAQNTNPPTSGAGPGTAGATNRLALQFLDVADMKGLGQISLPVVSWGAEFVDLDGDGWLDLVVANGNTIEMDGPAPKKLQPQLSFLFWNRTGDSFHNLAPLVPALTTPHVSRGLAVSDVDQDGAMDLFIAQLDGGVQLLRNEMQTGRWLKVRLHSRLADGSPRGFGDGARVTAWLGSVPLRRAVTGVSYLSQSSRTLHFGLGNASRVDRLEIRWLAGGTNVFQNLDADTTWEFTENDPLPRRWVPSSQAQNNAPASGSQPPQDARGRLVEFWQTQRAAMNAVKLENDPAKAVRLFRAALEFDPNHEDSHYYLAQSLAALGQRKEAVAELRELTRINPQSHRAFQAWGSLLASFSREPTDLAEAAQALRQARALNPEETGALVALAEVSLLQGQFGPAEQQLEDVCRTNPRAANAFFLRGFLAWKAQQAEQARHLLTEARAALGKEWVPAGATSEGDTKARHHIEGSPLQRFFKSWDGAADPERAFAALASFLKAGATP